MFFSPITERSSKVRLLYAAIYAALSLGALTMVVPFVLMLAGSVEPARQFHDSTFFPRYLFDDTALWRRFLESKYHGSPAYLRMAWNEPDADFRKVPYEPADTDALELWDTFLRDLPPSETLRTPGFLRPHLRMPSYYGRAFAKWLLAQNDGDVREVNEVLETQFANAAVIAPPAVSIYGAGLAPTPLVKVFFDFAATIPADRKFCWDAGGYYRGIILPRTSGPTIREFNAKFGTHYGSFSEVPFPATAPEKATDSWFFFVSRILRPDFVELTPQGALRQGESGLTKEEFVRLRAEPADLAVGTLDRRFAAWAENRGFPEARIPQKAVDYREFSAEKNFWRWQFLTLNYATVFDEIALRGRAIANTFILAGLMIGGSLIVNPLAAYALSRFKLRQTYYLLLFFLATIAFPTEVTMIPVFLQLKEMHLLNTFGALVLPSLANGFSIFLLKGFFDSLPRELYEAAELDGAGELRMFWQITMTLSKPILAVIALNAFTMAYGAFFYALILAPDPKMWTIMVYIYQLRQVTDSPVVFASLILTAVPTLLVFIFCQNIILRGIVVPTEK